jgi:phosphoserine phosphatase
MKYLKLYENFRQDDDTLYIFDFDDTLVNSPTFEELSIKFLKKVLLSRDF